MDFVLNRNKVVVSLTGRSIEFKKDVPVHVPQEMWGEVQGVGAIPAEDLPEEEQVVTAEPQDATERKTKIFAGFAQMVKAAKRESFTGTGVPHAKALASVIGFSIDSKERDVLWQEFNLQGKEE